MSENNDEDSKKALEILTAGRELQTPIHDVQSAGLDILRQLRERLTSAQYEVVQSPIEPGTWIVAHRIGVRFQVDRGIGEFVIKPDVDRFRDITPASVKAVRYDPAAREFVGEDGRPALVVLAEAVRNLLG
jgi:hypothetical protein